MKRNGRLFRWLPVLTGIVLFLVLAAPRCERVCDTNEDCTTSKYCARDIGECEESGICEPIPEACPEYYAPVCGCDGVTYDNECFAAMAGMSIDYDGACEQTSCWSNRECEPEDYCYFVVCAQETGVCLPRPENCPYLWDPVCGCDGITYANDCLAAMAGMSIDYWGECGPVCAANEDCDSDEFFCYKNPGDCDGTGVCTERPRYCYELLDPVCGCDAETYDNACFAAAAGMNVDYRGLCE